MGDGLLDVHIDFDQDQDLHVMILSGSGWVFCSGADVKQRLATRSIAMSRAHCEMALVSKTAALNFFHCLPTIFSMRHKA
jgi:enoyl-CoA hydratase/carnithine racemase